MNKSYEPHYQTLHKQERTRSEENTGFKYTVNRLGEQGTAGAN